MRVYTRFKNDKRNIDLPKTKKEIRNELSRIMPLETGDFNEALMELGESVCLPKGKPKCEDCPIREFCKAFKYQTWDKLPIRMEKRKKKELFFTIFLFSYQRYFAISRRDKEKLLQHLWEFPNISGDLTLEDIKKYLVQKDISYISIKKSIANKHVFTHQIWYMQAYLIEVSKKIANLDWKTLEEINTNYAIPTAFQPFLKELKRRENA